MELGKVPPIAGVADPKRVGRYLPHGRLALEGYRRVVMGPSTIDRVAAHVTDWKQIG